MLPHGSEPHSVPVSRKPISLKTGANATIPATAATSRLHGRKSTSQGQTR